jgi:hypothetical protein
MTPTPTALISSNCAGLKEYSWSASTPLLPAKSRAWSTSEGAQTITLAVMGPIVEQIPDILSIGTLRVLPET